MIKHYKYKLNLQPIAADWHPLLLKALEKMDQNYLKQLEQTEDWLPGAKNIFNAFQLPLTKTRCILFGESPYPRKASANGYAFWDGAVHEIWSTQGLSKQVNRATSLRNIIKMLLIARGDLSVGKTSQADIANVGKTHLVNTLDELFKNLLAHGLLLLNTSLVLSHLPVKKEAFYWHIFMETLLTELCQLRPDIQLILWGNIAKAIHAIPASSCFKQFHAEHPYNISFISNSNVINFFKPLNLLGVNYA